MCNSVESNEISEKIRSIIDFLNKNGVALPEINITKPSLEDVAIVCYYLNEYFKNNADSPDVGSPCDCTSL